MSSKVKDGTSCSDHDGNVCIDGVCEVRCLYSNHTARRMLHQTTSDHTYLQSKCILYLTNTKLKESYRYSEKVNSRVQPIVAVFSISEIATVVL